MYEGTAAARGSLMPRDHRKLKHRYWRHDHPDGWVSRKYHSTGLRKSKNPTEIPSLKV